MARTAPEHASSQRAGSHPLLEHSLYLPLYLMVRRILDRERMAALRERHLRWMIEEEQAGTVMMSGPVKASGGDGAMDGLTVIRAADEPSAHAIALGDPYVQERVMTFELLCWTVVEGCLPVRLTISDGRFALI